MVEPADDDGLHGAAARPIRHIPLLAKALALLRIVGPGAAAQLLAGEGTVEVGRDGGVYAGVEHLGHEAADDLPGRQAHEAQRLLIGVEIAAVDAHHGDAGRDVLEQQRHQRRVERGQLRLGIAPRRRCPDQLARLVVHLMRQVMARRLSSG